MPELRIRSFLISVMFAVALLLVAFAVVVVVAFVAVVVVVLAVVQKYELLVLSN